MKAIRLLSTLSLLAAAACGGGEVAGSATTSGQGTGGAGASTGTTTTPTTSSTGSGGSAGSDVVTLHMDPFTVPAGGEVYKCQNFANPFGGDGNVVEFESHMTPGSHHLLLFYKAGATDGQLEDCSGLEFAATPYSTQLPDDTVAFPSGVAALIPAGYGVRLQSHYLNTTSQPIQADVKMMFHTAKPETISQYAGVLFVVEPNIDVPAHSSAVVSHDCHLPFDMNLVKAGSHMHKHGTQFNSTIAGSPVVVTSDWDEPKPVFFDPARKVTSGDALHFDCHFQNDGDVPLTFGESAATNEMCIFVASYYPVMDPSQVTVGCQ